MRRVALLIPHTDVTLESDLQRVADGRFVVSTQRMWLESVEREDERRMVEEELPRALTYLRPVKADAAVFGCTSASVADGVDGEIRLRQRISAELGCPAVTAFGAVTEELRKRGARTVALVAPYTMALTVHVGECLTESGFEVVFMEGMGVDRDEEIANVKPPDIAKFVIERFVMERSRNVAPADALLVSCTNLRAFEVRDELERRLGLPVVTSNQAIAAQII